MHSYIPYMAQYWRVKYWQIWKIVVNLSKFNLTKNLPLKYLEYRADVICQFNTTKSLFIHSPTFYPSNILPLYFIMVHNCQSMIDYIILFLHIHRSHKAIKLI